MDTIAVVLEQPGTIALRQAGLAEATDADALVRISWSGISSGTEKLLYTGRMPPFPGMGYPLVPGYESVGVVTEAGARSGLLPGQTVFVPGATCFTGGLRGLFGGAASRLVVNGARLAPIPESLAERGTLLALAATAHHAVCAASGAPELVVGHGALGRLIARISAALHGAAPVVWETDPARRCGVAIAPDEDARRDYAVIVDATGDCEIFDSLIARLAPGGEIVLAGFYAGRVGFAFAPAFMREARLRVAAQWTRPDLDSVIALVSSGALSLDGLVTDILPAEQAEAAYARAFTDPACVKMILDWRAAA